MVTISKVISRVTLFSCALCLFAGSCGDGSSRGGGNSSSSSAGATSGSISENTISVPDGSTKFSVIATVNSGAVRFDSIKDPDGKQVVQSGGQQVSLATSFEPALSTANIPSREKDGSIKTGQYTIITETSDNQNVELMVQSSNDPDLSNGTLIVNIISVGSLAKEGSVQSALDRAIPVMTEIYQRALGISTIVNRITMNGPNSLPAPIAPSSFFESASNDAPQNAVNVFITGDISDIPIGALGIASSIPGPPIPSSRSAVVISITESAGADGVISGSEIRLLGETIAHESGHYLGLFHPVEIDPFGEVNGSDPLDDTNNCGNFDSCVSNESLSRNLMFPFPVVGSGGQLIPQDQLTPDQRGVVNRNVLVQ